MIHHIPITQARINLGAITKRAYLKKEVFILEKDGIPIAGLLNIDDLEDYLEMNDPVIRKHIEKSHDDYLNGKVTPARAMLAELRKKYRK